MKNNLKSLPTNLKPSLKDIFTVMKFTMRDMLKRRSFMISTIIILVLIVLGFNVPNILNAIDGGEGNLFASELLVVDRDQVLGKNIEQLHDLELPYKLKITDLSDDDIATQLNDGEADGALVLQKSDNTISLTYLVKNLAVNSTTPDSLIEAVSEIYLRQQIDKLNLTPAELASVSPEYSFTVAQTSDEEIGGDLFVMMGISLVLFYAVYFCAFQVSSSITTEKTSKIMETLVTSTSPRNIVLGKTIGIGVVGLLQMILFVVVAIISALLFVGSDSLSSIIDLSHFTPFLALITILYFILGYFMYALLYALTGSTVSKPEDIQSANTPIAIITLVGFYLAYFTLTDPTSELNVFAALFPISSPFCMPVRVAMGLASGAEIAISILILLIAIAVIAHIAIKIYSNAILNYGTKLSWGEIIKSYKENK